MKFDDFMEEVQNDIRQAKVEHYWALYGKQAVAGCAALLVASVFYTLHKNRQENLALSSSEKLVAGQNALIQGRYDEAETLFDDVIKNSPSAYTTLSLFNKVGALLKKNTTESKEKAIDVLKQIESSSSVEKEFKTLAMLIRFSHEVGTVDPKSEAFAQMRLKVDEYALKNNTMSYLAKEIKGLMLYKVKAIGEAADIFVKLIQDPQTPQAIKFRAQLMGQILSSKSDK